MSKNLYKLAWFLTPIIFLLFLFTKGKFCFMGSCAGDNNVGIVFGIGAVIVYSILLKLLKVSTSHKNGNFSREFWDVNGIKSGFFFILLALIIALVYFLGKING